jgi:isopenicillin N synthase-like dioxygenase
MIPIIDVSRLFDRPSLDRDAADGAVKKAAADIGFMTIVGMPASVPLDAATRANLLRIFQLPAEQKQRLYRRKYAASQPNIYRGWFPLTEGGATYKEGIDIGPDVANASWVSDPRDPLTEATPMPSGETADLWRTTAAAYYHGMEMVGSALMRSIARGLALPETYFDGAFKGSISTLRLIRYPVRGDASPFGDDQEPIWVEHNGVKRSLSGAAHVDSGVVTLLAQDGVDGLQAQSRNGLWLDVPPLEGSLAVNFGGVLERWTGGHFKATEHRVLGTGRERHSIPFFYEPRVDQVIAPLPLADAEPFQPFTYGDHVWTSMMKFVEFDGLDHLRRPRLT